MSKCPIKYLNQMDKVGSLGYRHHITAKFVLVLRNAGHVARRRRRRPVVIQNFGRESRKAAVGQRLGEQVLGDGRRVQLPLNRV